MIANISFSSSEDETFYKVVKKSKYKLHTYISKNSPFMR